MMAKLTIDEQNAQMNWCDLSLCSVSWIEEGRDVVLCFLIPPSDREIRLACRWVSGLRVALAFESNLGGYPLSWDAELKRAEGEGWSILFDFADAGSLSLTCQELEFIATMEDPARG